MIKETIEITGKELKDLLKYVIDNNKNIQEKGDIPAAIEVIGEAGIGKTTIIVDLAKELDLNFVKLNLSQLEELGDLTGLPVKEYKVIKKETKLFKYKTAEGEIKTKEQSKITDEKWVSESELDFYIKSNWGLSGEKRMSYCVPDWIQGKGEGGILLLDDYSRADLRFTQATMELIDRQSYMGWSLPKGWTIVLSSNPDNGNYFVTSMDNAQKTRYISIGLKFNVEAWAEWAEMNSVDSRCINFMLQHPEVIEGDINARSATTFFKSISSIEDFEKESSLIFMLSAGTIGNIAGAIFTQWIVSKQDKMITPQRILLEGSNAQILTELKEVLHDGADYRADIASVIANRICNFTIAYVEKGGSVDQKLISRLEALIVENGLFNIDLKFIIAKKIAGYNRTKFQKLIMIPEVTELLTR